MEQEVPDRINTQALKFFPDTAARATERGNRCIQRWRVLMFQGRQWDTGYLIGR